MTQNLTKETGQQCFLPLTSQGLWGRTAWHLVEVQLLPWKGSGTVWPAQSVSTNQTGTEKQTHQTQPPGHCPALTTTPTMNHQEHRRVLGCTAHPSHCYCKHLLNPHLPPCSCSVFLLRPTQDTQGNDKPPPPQGSSTTSLFLYSSAFPRHHCLGRNLGTDVSYPDL